MNYETLEKEILLYKPNIVGISIPFTVMLKPALKLIKSVREYLPIAGLLLEEHMQRYVRKIYIK